MLGIHPSSYSAEPHSTETYEALRRNAGKNRLELRGFGRHFATKPRRPRRQGRHQFPPPRPTPTAPAFKSQHTALSWAPAKRRGGTRRVPTLKFIPCPKRLACPRHLRATKYSHSGCLPRNVEEESVRHKRGCVRYFETQQRRPKRLDRPGISAAQVAPRPHPTTSFPAVTHGQLGGLQRNNGRKSARFPRGYLWRFPRNVPSLDAPAEETPSQPPRPPESPPAPSPHPQAATGPRSQRAAT